MQLNLNGKVALITGGSLGIGFATALSLCEEGVKVAICSRNQSNLERAILEIYQQFGSQTPIIGIKADLPILKIVNEQ